MASEQAQAFDRSAGPSEITTAEIVDRLSRFDGPPEQFLVNLLSVQCRIASASAGVVMRVAEDGRVELLAAFPQLPAGSTAPVWVAQTVESSSNVVSGGKTAIRPLHDSDDLYGQAAKRHVIMMPIRGTAAVRGLAAFLVETGDQRVLDHCRERLELSVSLLSLYEMRLTLQRRNFDLQRLRVAMETLGAVNESNRAAGAAMAFCNELASRWACERTALGFLKGRSVKLKALSHTEKIIRKMKLVQDIESAMEECLDQDVEVFSPAPKDATYVSRMTDELSRLHGPTSVLSLPLRLGGRVVGAATLERPQDQGFALDEVESLRLTVDLCAARLHDLHETDRWFGARAGQSLRKALSFAVGTKHTWAKVAAIGVFAFLVFMFVGKGDFRANATFVVEAQQQRLVPAPFDGYIEDVFVERGDVVTEGTRLAKLETADLESELAKTQAEYEAARKEANSALTEGKIAEVQIAKARAEQADVQIRLLERKIADATITAPIDGTVISPDITRRIRGHVSIGDPMFEIAPVEALRAELSVPEDEIADVVIAFETARGEDRQLTGELATEGRPGQRIPFVVERINPVAEVEEHENVFAVRVALLETHGGMLPGAKGVAKIDVGRRTYAFIWTRKLVNWIRMKLWI